MSIHVDGTTVDGWNPVNSPVEVKVVYPIIHKVMYIYIYQVVEPTPLKHMLSKLDHVPTGWTTTQAFMLMVLGDASVKLWGDYFFEGTWKLQRNLENYMGVSKNSGTPKMDGL